MSWTAANGQKITEEMIGEWCNCYERGEFPKGEHTVGNVVVGRPPLSSDKTVTMSVKLPEGMRVAVRREAKKKGMTDSAYVRSILASALTR